MLERSDPAAAALLDQVLADWLRRGPLACLLQLIAQVWRTDLQRHDPELGDDAQTLGILASRNLCNLAVRRLSGLPAVRASDRRTLEVVYGARVLHVGKAPSESLTWDVTTMDWSSSEVRDDAARANSEAYLAAQGTLFELIPFPGRTQSPTALAHLHLAWQGFPDGTTRAWLGFPRLGAPAWFAVTPLDILNEAAA